MAILNLTIHGVNLSQDPKKEELADVLLSTEEKKDAQGVATLVKKVLNLPNLGKQPAEQSADYNLSLINLQFHKKMYQPTEIIAEISVTKAKGAWVAISRDVIVNLFNKKKASLVDVQDVADLDKIPDHKKVGEDFYVEDVQVSYRSRFMRVFLTIYSLDKLMTQENYCRTFVGKKLKEGILKSELLADVENSKYVSPYSPKKALTFDADSMQNLSYDYKYKDKDKSEHIFPYLVQYNESFYDMLARTTNRWGEFMYYEGGKLIIGCPTSTAIPLPMTSEDVKKQGNTLPLFSSIDYVNVDSQESKGEKYDCAAGYDGNMQNAPIRIDPAKVSGNLFCWGGKWDKVIMKKFTSFFKLDKNLPTFIGNELFADLYDLGKQKINVASENNAREEEFFNSKMKDNAPEQYGNYDYGKGDEAMSYNPFSEIKTVYDKKKYFDILKNEISAGKEAVRIDFDTSYPCLKLGQTITVYNKEYIVVQVDCNTHIPEMVQDNIWVISSGKAVYSFQVIALAKQGDQFYPTVIPSGHVRLAEPQMATVDDAGDPNGDGRVRVAFPWQCDKDGKLLDGESATPWIQYTANAGGKSGLMGKHYKDDKVFVGFVDGNVERPYVLGAVSKGAGADVHCATPGGHVFKLKDDSAGITAFLTGMFTPVYGTLTDFIPELGDINPFSGDKNNLALAGGFELTDNYGIYKISGSTEDREVNIASPWGNVNINAFTGISISAPNGDIEIKGKNVSIQAGNNLELISGTNVSYKLWKEKNTDKGTAAQALLDVTAAVTKKLAEKLTQVIDLSMVRAAAEVVFKPIEGSLTAKSNRFLKLEAGKNECEYPVAAFNVDKKKKMLDAENKSSILSAVGSSTNFLGKWTNLSLDNGMVTLINSTKPAAEALAKDFRKKLNACVEAKAKYLSAIANLKKWSSDKEVGCNTLDEMKNALWKAEEDKDFTEAEVGFKPNVDIIPKADERDINKLTAAIPLAVVRKILDLAPNATVKKSVSMPARRRILANRRKYRKEVLNTANALRKAIYELQRVKVTKKDIYKYFSWYWQTMPKDFKDTLVKAMDKDAFGTKSPIFNFPDDKKSLNFDTADDIITNSVLLKHTRRLVLYNLLTELGFTKETRKKVGAAVPPDPAIDDLNSRNDTSLLNDTYWSDFVSSLNGVPPIEKDYKTVGGQLRAAATSSIDDIKEQIYGLKNMRKEIATWGEGKNGRILFGTDGTTFEMKKNEFKEVVGITPNVTYLSKDSDNLDDHQKKKLGAFVDAMKKAIIDNQF